MARSKLEKNIFAMSLNWSACLAGRSAPLAEFSARAFQRLTGARPARFAPVELDCGVAADAGITAMPGAARRLGGIDVARLAAAVAFILYGKEPSN